MHGLLRWGLTPDGDGTLLSFRSTLELDPEYETLVPAGWHFHLDALRRHLEGGIDRPGRDPRVGAIHERYVAVVGGSSSAPRR